MGKRKQNLTGTFPDNLGKEPYACFLSPEVIKNKYPVIKDGNWDVRNEKQ
ncbi:hypothetical protein [Methanohalophilus sp.]|nr:hypothetical protein [Methanohalophilus sp.]